MDVPKKAVGIGSSDTSLPADVFHVASGQEEIVLVFGQQRRAAAGPGEERLVFKRKIVLNPFAAKRFAIQLQDALRIYEIGRDPPERASVNAAPRTLATRESDPGVRRLLDFVGHLGGAYGLERSFKVFDHTLLANRFLATMAKDTVRAPVDRRLLDLCARIGMPRVFMDLYREHLPFAKYVHFGYEENQRRTISKAYLEFPLDWETEMLQKPIGADSVLLYLGFKWDPSENSLQALTRYTGYPRLPLENMLERVAAHYAGSSSKECLEITRGIVQTAVDRIGAEQILFLEVSEADNPRNSFDINFYRAKLSLDAYYPHLLSMCRHFHIPEKDFSAFIDPIRSKRFGHLSGGIDRQGKDFLTVYYGVEGRSMETFSGASGDSAPGIAGLSR